MTRCLLFLACCFVPATRGQGLAGVIDAHVHAGPRDVIPRSADALRMASLAVLARKHDPGLEVFGGIALNRSVGGINPAATDLPR